MGAILRRTRSAGIVGGYARAYPVERDGKVVMVELHLLTGAEMAKIARSLKEEARALRQRRAALRPKGKRGPKPQWR